MLIQFVLFVANKAAECSVCQGRSDKDPARQIQSDAGRAKPAETAGIEGD